MEEEGSEEPGTIVINSDVIVKQEVNFEQEDPGSLEVEPTEDLSYETYSESQVGLLMDIVEVKVEHDEDNFTELREYALKNDPDFDAAALLHPNTKKKGGRPRKGVKSFSCTECDFTTHLKRSLKGHIRTIHEQKITEHLCDICQCICASSGALKLHRENIHENIRHICDICNFAATSKSYLKEHKEIKHLGIRWTCNLCNFVALRKNHLNKHKATVHEGKKYPCDLCDHLATNTSHLKRHKQTIHFGIRYSCDQCSYTASRMDYLNHHVNTKHKLES